MCRQKKATQRQKRTKGNEKPSTKSVPDSSLLLHAVPRHGETERGRQTGRQMEGWGGGGREGRQMTDRQADNRQRQRIQAERDTEKQKDRHRDTDKTARQKKKRQKERQTDR